MAITGLSKAVEPVKFQGDLLLAANGMTVSTFGKDAAIKRRAMSPATIPVVYGMLCATTMVSESMLPHRLQRPPQLPVTLCYSLLR
jgi:hypothetical protein